MSMFWNKKEAEQKLPDLPPMKIPSMPQIPHDEEEDNEILEKHGLPSFPDSPIQKGFSQAAIKDAISNDEIKSEEEIANPTRNEKAFKAVEMEEWTPNTSQNYNVPANVLTLPPTVKRGPVQVNIQKESKNNDVFVKIDRFYSAKKSLEATESKLEEIDELLKKIRETKMREEQELAAWEKEIATIKSRIKEVTDTIFEKI